MDAEETGESAARWPWVLVLIATLAVAFLSVGMQSGYCLDAEPGAGPESFCVTEPVIGPGVVILFVFCGLLAALAIYRIVRITVRRRG